MRVSKDSSRPGAHDLFLPTRGHRSRAIHGDVVAIQAVNKSDWGCPDTTLGDDETDEATSTTNANAAGRQSRSDRAPTGRVVAVLNRTDRHYVATIEDDGTNVRDGTTVAVLAVPMDARLPKFR
eukprot:SAG31_NODE_616_length_13519_cov_2.372876_3_plen_124_part_00